MYINISKLILQCKVFSWMQNDELDQLLTMENEKIGVFKNQFNGKINIVIGVVAGDNFQSKILTDFLMKYRQKGEILLESKIYRLAKKIFPDVVQYYLKSENKKHKVLKIYLNRYLKKLSNFNTNEATEKLFQEIFPNINFIFFYLHANERESILVYNIYQSPVIFSFVNSGFISPQRSRMESFIYKNPVKNINDNEFDKILSKIIFVAFQYYIETTLDLSIVG